MDISFETVDGVAPHVLRVEQLHQVVNIRGRQPQGLDLGQLGIARNVGDTIPQRSKSVINRLRPPTFLLVAANT